MNFDDIIRDFLNIAKGFPGIKCIILFGSFAKNKQSKTSDIDIAISGDYDHFHFLDRINSEINTLRHFDIINYDEILSKSLKSEIDNYGRVLYKV